MLHLENYPSINLVKTVRTEIATKKSSVSSGRVRHQILASNQDNSERNVTYC